MDASPSFVLRCCCATASVHFLHLSGNSVLPVPKLLGGRMQLPHAFASGVDCRGEDWFGTIFPLLNSYRYAGSSVCYFARTSRYAVLPCRHRKTLQRIIRNIFAQTLRRRNARLIIPICGASSFRRVLIPGLSFANRPDSTGFPFPTFALPPAALTCA